MSGRGLWSAPNWVGEADAAALAAELAALHPIWERRFSTRRPPPKGEAQRSLLRPVYWLGNWQFACLGYYEPPRRTRDCAVEAEPFPPTLARLARAIEARVRKSWAAADVPREWELNTCLVNLYGERQTAQGWEDVARVGEHADYEPGPVASISLGERARFQFVSRGHERKVLKTENLDDRSLLVFGGPYWKGALLHRVQRVEDKGKLDLPPKVEGFRTRRINLTLRYVPVRDVIPLEKVGREARLDVEEYVRRLAEHSPFWAEAANRAYPRPGES